MHTWYLISVWLHILGAIVWIGGMVFLGVVIVPILREAPFEQVRSAMLYRIGLKFRWVGWMVLALLVVTGITNLGHRGYGWADAVNGVLWSGPWGNLLAWKVGLVVIVLAGSAWHDFWIGPRAAKLMESDPGSSEAKALRRTASYAGRVMLLASLVILALAVMLVRGW